MRLKTILLVAFLAAEIMLQAASLTQEQSGAIAQAVAKMIGQVHYRQKPLNDEMSRIFLSNYIDALDLNHLVFLQKDIDGFQAKYATELDDITLKGDISPAHEIRNLYLKRLGEKNKLVENLIKNPFQFTTKEQFNYNRTKALWPANDAEAQTLWNQRIKFELLADRLSKPKAADDVAATKKALEVIQRRYQRLLKTVSDMDESEVLETYLSSMTHAYDPHSDYMSPAEAENFDINSVKMKLTGIGAVLQAEDGYTKIVRIMPGGPAEKGKLIHANDRVVAVAQGKDEPVDVIEMKLNKVVSMIRGAKGTEVRLTIIPSTSTDGATKVISIIRDEVPLADQMAKAYIIDKKDGAKTERIGVIDLPGFYDNCTSDVAILIDRLKQENIHGLVLDLRKNGGGLLPEAVNLTGLFIETGPVVQIRNFLGQIQKLNDRDKSVKYDGPLVVAVSHMSASASEIVAGALQDYGRAVIVGGKITHGKGTVQQLIPIQRTAAKGLGEDKGQLKFTISKFYRISGSTTQMIGVTPDVILPSIFDHMEIGELRLPNALPADQIQAADFTKLNRAQQYFDSLKQRSAARIVKDTDYKYVNEDIVRMEKQQATKSVSLNESERIKERDDLKAITEARKSERAKRAASGEKLFELRLDAAKNNQPLKPFEPKKTTETPPTGTAPDEIEALLNQDNPLNDHELRETIRVLQDYIKLSHDGVTKNN